MQRAGGIAVYNLHKRELLVGELRGSSTTGQLTLCFNARKETHETEAMAGYRAIRKKAGEDMKLGPPKEINTFGPVIYKTTLDKNAAGKVMGVRRQGIKYRLDTTLTLFACELRGGRPQETHIRKVRNLRFMHLLEIEKRIEEFAHDQTEIYYALLTHMNS